MEVKAKLNFKMRFTRNMSLLTMILPLYMRCLY